MSLASPPSSRPLHPTAEHLCLHGRNSSVILELVPGEAPLWRYWGARLPADARPDCRLRGTRPLPSFSLEFDQPLTVLPTFGVGWFHHSALLAHRAGQAFAQAFQDCVVQWLVPDEAVSLTLTDAVAELETCLTLRLDPTSDVLSIHTTLRNLGSQPLEVQWLAAATLPLPDHCDTVRSYAGQHMHEFLLQTDTLSRTQWRRESRRGRTSHDCFPGAVVTTPGSTAAAGLVYGAHLAWSGNHQQTIEWLPDGRYQWQLGEWLAPGEGLLAPGACLRTPEVVATLSTAGLDGLAANFHAELRRRVPWPGGQMAPRPVHLNTWEGFYFDVHPKPVMALATAAARLGVERFVLDDGWFHGRHHDRAALGDWWPDETKFPHGLAPLIAHVNDLGMSFGLWVEPEMVNPDSDLYRAHPEWALALAGRPVLTARNQLVLDLSRREVADYLFGKLSALLTAHPITYLKWDHNRDLTTAGLANGLPGYRAQVHAVYVLLDRLRTAHPDVEIESCSGGGGRIDFGILRHTHRTWASDCIDALSRLQTQAGFLQFFPPEILGAHVGTAPAHTTGRSQGMSFRCAVALPGHFGVELDARHLATDETAALQAWIATYKLLRDRLHRGHVWHGDAGDGIVWQMHGDASGQRWVLLAYRIAPSTFRYAPAIRLPMLQPDAQYRVRECLPLGSSTWTGRQSSAAFFEQLATPDGQRIAGAWLMHAGLPTPRCHAETAFIVEIDRLDAEAPTTLVAPGTTGASGATGATGATGARASAAATATATATNVPLVHRRRNLLNGDWVLVSPHRNLRPWQGQQEVQESPTAVHHDPACYLCAGNTRITGEVNPAYAGPYAFTNDFPALLPASNADDDRTAAPPAADDFAAAQAPAGELPAATLTPGDDRKAAADLFVAEPVHGTARVVCFSPDHAATLGTLPVDAIAAVVRTWMAESAALGATYRWVQVFENKGAMMGCSNPHPHSQIWAQDTLPREAEREDAAQRAWLTTHHRPLLLQVAEAEIDAGARVVCCNDDWLVIVPWWAAWPFETLLLPRFAVQRLQDLALSAVLSLATILADLARRYDQLFACSFPYTMGWHGAPNGSATTEQHWQLHAHFLPPLLRSATVRKFMVGYELLAEAQRDLTPEDAAQRLRALPGLGDPGGAADTGAPAHVGRNTGGTAP